MMKMVVVASWLHEDDDGAHEEHQLGCTCLGD